MTSDERIDQSLRDDPPAPTEPALARGDGRLERVVVTTGDGRTFDLGSPHSRLYRLRLARYGWRRRREFGRG